MTKLKALFDRFDHYCRDHHRRALILTTTVVVMGGIIGLVFSHELGLAVEVTGLYLVAIAG